MQEIEIKTKIFKIYWNDYDTKSYQSSSILPIKLDKEYHVYSWRPLIDNQSITCDNDRGRILNTLYLNFLGDRIRDSKDFILIELRYVEDIEIKAEGFKI